MQQHPESDWQLPLHFTQKVFDITPGLITVYNVNSGRYHYVNRAVEQILGYQASDIITGGFEFVASLVHPEDLERVMTENITAVQLANERYPDYNDNSIKEFEYRMRHHDGHYRWIHTYGIIFSRNDGIVELILNISVDVTARKQAEQQVLDIRDELRHLNNSLEKKVSERTRELENERIALKKQTEFNALISKATEDVFWDWQMVPDRLTWTGNYRDLLGDTSTNTEHGMDGWLNRVHPVDREKLLATISVNLSSGHESWSHEYRMLKPGGQYAIILDRAYIVRDETGQPYRMVGCLTDISQYREAELTIRQNETRFRALADAIPQMVWTSAPDGAATYYNKVWYEYAGKPDFDTLKASVWNLIHPDDKELTTKTWQAAIMNGTDVEVEQRLLRADGEYRWHLSRAVAQRDAAGGVKSWVGSCTDIHLHKLSQEAASLEMQKKDEFLSIASHELKTPITSMKAALQLAARLAARSPIEGQLPDLIGRANKQVDKLTQLVENLLDVTRIQAGKMEFMSSAFSIKDLVNDCLAELQYAKGDHEFIVEIDQDTLLFADKHRLEQVIANLVSNALKYSPGGKQIIISCKVNDGWFKFSITDFGIGIPKAKLSFVFDRFFRVQESSHNFSGLGLGLFISAEIIKRHHGKIGVDSEEGNGSTFWFTIPLKMPAIS